MLNAKEFKEFAIACGADIVAMGPVDRLEGAPRQMDARLLMPRAKTLIGFGFRHARGLFRGIEEGTFFASYASMGYASINKINHTLVAGQMMNHLEDRGYEAIPAYGLRANVMDAYGLTPSAQASMPNPKTSVPLKPGMPPPDVFVSQRIAAMAAGLGEIGWSKMLLSKKFGPRQRTFVILTDAEFDCYDPVVKPGTICDRCKACVRACTGGCIPAEQSVRITLAGYDVEWADIDFEKCRIFYRGGNPQYNPFNVNEEDRMEFPKEIFKETGLTWHKLPPYYEYARPLEGASGCIRACMCHLEQTGRIENLFHNKFAQSKRWRVDANPILSDEDIEAARKTGGGGLKAVLQKRLDDLAASKTTIKTEETARKEREMDS